MSTTSTADESDIEVLARATKKLLQLEAAQHGSSAQVADCVRHQIRADAQEAIKAVRGDTDE